MRVTQNTNLDVVKNSINTSKGRLEKYQEQAATLRKLNTPSDDPVGAAKVLEVRTEKVNNQQFVENSKMAEAFLNNTDHALEDLSNIVVRAKEIAIGQASGASATAETRIAVAEEVDQLFQQAVATANRKVGNRYIFGGYRTDQPPVDNLGKYQGDDGQIMTEIAKDVFVSANLPGVDVFNTAPKGSGDLRRLAEKRRELASAPDVADEDEDLPAEMAREMPKTPENANLFSELQNLRIGLLTNNIESIQNTLDRFDSLQDRVNATRAKVGSRVRGIASAMDSAERQMITNSRLTSEIEDADMVKVMNDMAQEETILRSSMESSKRLIQPTLLDFLR